MSLIDLVEIVKQQNQRDSHSSSPALGTAFGAATPENKLLDHFILDDKLLDMLLIERDCRVLPFDEAYLMLAVRLSLAADDEDIPQLVRDCYQELHMRTFENPSYCADIDHEIWTATELLVYTPIDNPNRPELLRALGYMFARRFNLTDKPSDLGIAICCFYQLILLTASHDSCALMSDMFSLGTLCQIRYEHTGKLADIDQSITCHRHLADCTWSDLSSASIVHKRLGALLYSRYERTGGLADIDQSIAASHTALSHFPDGHPHKLFCANNLALAYTRRFEAFNRLSDVDASIEWAMLAVSMTPDNHFCRAERLCQLGNAYSYRYELLGKPTDLELAIYYHQEAVACRIDEDEIHALCLDSLGTSLSLRFNIHQEISDLNQSISCHSAAMNLTLERDPSLPERLNNLGNAHGRRFASLGAHEDLEISIECLEYALHFTDEYDPRSLKWIENLGVSLIVRFERMGQPEDLENAINWLQIAQSHTPMDYSRRPNLLMNLGMTYYYNFNRLGRQEDLEKSVHLFSSAALSINGSASDLFLASDRWAVASNQLTGSPCLEAYTRAMELIPRMIWVGTKMTEQYQNIPEVSHMVLKAVGAAMVLGEYGLALEWFEQGRSIMWNQMLQLRSSMDDLAHVNPTLYQELSHVAHGLDEAFTPKGQTAVHLKRTHSVEEDAQCHHRLAERWEDLLAEARRLPGFRGFLKPKSAKDLACVAKDRAVAIVIVELNYCSVIALPLGSESPIHIPLPDFSFEKAVRARKHLLNSIPYANITERGIKAGDPPTKNVFESILSMLWVDVAKPVLDCLGYTKPNPSGELPRVTWCTTGPVSFLPLHAAGLYDVPHSRVFDFVVSSYTPSLNALVRDVDKVSDFRGMVAVGQSISTTPEFSHLEGTTEELDRISKHAARSNITFNRIENQLATTSAVSDAISRHSWVHLACHGSQHRSEPSASAFHLHDGSLDLASIIKNPLPHASLAFLSACETATGDEAMPEESMHLAAGMIMAGYPSVIGTMWSIRDGDAPIVADRVYAELLKDGVPNSRGAARALHKATEELRNKVGERMFSAWVPYIHIGI
ncbi:CHAT domain protein [Ceratobasidium sp. AG-Ba]|nr:CHAT domain protein [Ceratobasidium sp. AG-Ba]